MPKRPRSPKAALRASFGRAERLRREAGDRVPRPDPGRQQQRAKRSRAAQGKDRTPAIGRTAARERKLTALDKVRERVDRAATKTERQRQQRLEKQTRAEFNQRGERRRDAEYRAEQERSRQHVEATRKKAGDHRRGAARKATERKRDQVRAAFSKEAARRQDAARRLAHDRLRERAAVEIEREQRRQIESQKAEHGRQRDHARVKRNIARDSFHDRQDAALEHHFGEISTINNREARELADFDGRRRGLAGRTAELIPGRRAENDRKRADMVRGYESERLVQHRKLEALKERQHANEQKSRLGYFQELKKMQGRHREERNELGRAQNNDRPRLVDDRARAIERADRAREQVRQRELAERPRENVRPAGDFRAAHEHVRETAPAAHEVRQEEREMVRPAQGFGRS